MKKSVAKLLRNEMFCARLLDCKVPQTEKWTDPSQGEKGLAAVQQERDPKELGSFIPGPSLPLLRDTGPSAVLHASPVSLGVIRLCHFYTLDGMRGHPQRGGMGLGFPSLPLLPSSWGLQPGLSELSWTLCPPLPFQQFPGEFG